MGLNNESLAEFRLYEVDRIIWDVKCLDLSQRCVTVDGKPQGLVDVLISMDDLCEAPSDYEPKGRLIHYKSPFGIGFIVCEALVHLKEHKGQLTLLKWLGQ